MPFSSNKRILSIQMDLAGLVMIGGLVLKMMTTMTMTEIVVVMMMMAMVLLVPHFFLSILHVCVSKFILFACLNTAFPKKVLTEFIINYLL